MYSSPTGRRPWLATTVVCCTGWLIPASAAADYLVLMNGDRLTGTVLTETGTSVILESSVLGRLTVKRAEVASVTRDPRAAATSPASASGERIWSGEASVGWDLSHGNSPSSAIGTHAVLARVAAHDKLGLFGSSMYSANGSGDAQVITVRSARSGARYDRDLTGRLFLFGFGEGEHDLLQLLDLRTVVGGGTGLHLFKSDHTQLNVTAGASLARDAYANAVTEPAPVSSAPSTTGVPPANAAGKGLATAPGQNRGRNGTPPTVVRTSLNRRVGEWFAGQDLWQQVTDSVDVNQRVAFYAATSDPADYRISFDLGLGVQLNRWLQWNLSVTDRYLHIPPAGGAVQNDLYIATGMGVSFGHGAEGAYTGADGRPADR